MAYAFSAADATVADAVRRVAREQAEEAIAAAEGEGELGPRVHTMRKAIKKLRGLLRLVAPVLREAKAENALLRDAGRELSQLRDGAVQLGTLGALTEGMEGWRREALLQPFQLEAAAQEGRAAELLPEFAGRLAAFRDRAEGWMIARDGWAVLAPGLEATWRATRAAMRAARDGDAEAVHEWRKRAKDHWYQARLLTPIWPEMMRPHVASADELGELLGQANDLAVLEERLDAAPLASDLREEARERARARAAELMAAAWPLGRRLFAGKAEGLSRRWGVWWEMRGA
jgi:CHAD domain-containing protein